LESTTTDDIDAWRVFAAAARMLADKPDVRVNFALPVPGSLIDSGCIPAEVLMAACCGAMDDLSLADKH